MRALWLCVGAARLEPAPWRQGGHLRRPTRHGLQPGAGRPIRLGVEQTDGVWMGRTGEYVVHRRLLHDLACVHDHDAITDAGDHPEVVCHQDHPQSPVHGQFADQFQDLGLDGHVESGGRFIGYQHRRLVEQAHSDHHPLQHSPRELVGMVPHPDRRFRHTNPGQSLDCPISGFAAGHAVMPGHRLCQLPSDREAGMERADRVLEDHGDLRAAHPSHLLGVKASRFRP